MIVQIDVTDKSFGDKTLYTDLHFTVQAGEKVGLIGRNGTGKSTLFAMITGQDTDYQGEIVVRRNATVIASRQEHHGLDDKPVLEYILSDLPEFSQLHHIMTTYPLHMGDDTRKLQRYSDALERFGALGYYQVEDEIAQSFTDYQLDPALLERPLGGLSGGQKRMVELIKVQRARADVALIDEPTNHMDYVAKQAFVNWLNAAQEAVLVITHDRDVLGTVDKIVEIRDGRAYIFKGNYEQYLRVNKTQVTSQVNEYDVAQRRIENLKADIIRFRRLKERSRDPGTIKRFKSQEERARAELAELEQVARPSFWIDRDSADSLNDKMTTAYGKYKAQNIAIHTKTTASRSSRLLVQATGLSLGYTAPLFSGMDFSVREGERIRLHGRNGAGKTTLVHAIMSKAQAKPLAMTAYDGSLAAEHDMRVGLYEQEIADHFLDMTLADAIEQSFREYDVPVTDQKIKQLLGDYLFNPIADGDMPVARLSGGQKARFQLIRMLLHEPQLLILDEPTNHLDLPSIEELENALADYAGAVIYISHDSYFAEHVGGTTVAVGA